MATTKQVGIRLEPDLIARLDAYAKSREDETPGQNVTRTDAVKILLEKGLAEAGFARRSKARRK